MRHSRRHRAFVLGLFLLTAILLAMLFMQTGSAAAARYTFGVIPQFEQRKLHGIWKPIIEELERRTGLSFDLNTTLRIQDFEKELITVGFDFAYTSPYPLLRSRAYIPLVSDKKPMRGILVVRKDSAITKAADLDGKTVAFPSPNAFGASLMLRADLERLHHVKVNPLYVKTHSSVYLHVVKGLAAAGGGVEKTLQEQAPQIRDALRVIYTTRGVQSHPVAAHTRVPGEDREKVRRAFLAMDATSAGRALLSRVPIQKVTAVSMKDYRALLGLGLDDYVDPAWSED